MNLDAFELVDELPPGKHANDMVWTDEWRDDLVRSRLCVRQFRAEGLRHDLFAGTPDTFFIQYLLAKAASCKDFGLLVFDISVAFMHARTDEEIYVKVPSGVKSSRFWRLKAAVNGTRKASKHWQEFSCDKLVTNMLFQQNDINPCTYKRCCDNLDLEQHGDDFRVCGSVFNWELLVDEFKNNLLVKTPRHCLQYEGNHERGQQDRPQPQRQKLKRIALYLKRTSAMCAEFPLGGKAGRRHPCDRGCRLGWRPKDKVLHVWWSVGNRSVLHSSTLVSETGNSIAVLSGVRGQGDHEGLHWSVVSETPAGTPDCTTVQN